MRKFNSVVVLTGAGISAESGLKTFRGHDGLWENHPIEDVASIDGFRRDPQLVQEFYNMRRAQLLTPAVKPNPAHYALAKLEKEFKGSFVLVTQNVDDLHERSGQRELLHMHGELLKVRCLKSSKIFEWREAITASSRCACCSKTGTLRPHIVWFGEEPLFMPEIFARLEECDLFVSVGTSGQVYPAAGFVRMAAPGAHKIEINMEETDVSSAFDEHITGPASVKVPEFVDRILGSQEAS